MAEGCQSSYAVNGGNKLPSSNVLPKFGAKGTEDYASWLLQVSEACELYSVLEEKRIIFVASALEVPART
jgi:hypothetical protein